MRSTRIVTVLALNISLRPSWQVLKLLKLLRIARLLRYFARWEEHLALFNSHTLRLLKVIMMVVIFAHWNACIQFYLGTYDTTEIVEDTCSCAVSEHCGVIHKDVWMCRANIMDLSPEQKWSWYLHTSLELSLTVPQCTRMVFFNPLRSGFLQVDLPRFPSVVQHRLWHCGSKTAGRAVDIPHLHHSGDHRVRATTPFDTL